MNSHKENNDALTEQLPSPPDDESENEIENSSDVPVRELPPPPDEESDDDQPTTGENLSPATVPSAQNLSSILRRGRARDDEIWARANRVVSFDDYRRSYHEQSTSGASNITSSITRSKSYDQLCFQTAADFERDLVPPHPGYLSLGEYMWGKTRKWRLWNVWDNGSLQNYITTECSRRKGILHNKCYTKPELRCLINNTLTRIDDLFLPLQNDEFIIVRIAQEPDAYFMYSRRFETEAEVIMFRTSPLTLPFNGFVTTEGEDRLLRSPFNVLASGGLAELLEVGLNNSDILIISGGYRFVYEKKLMLALNYDVEKYTHIIRISANTIPTSDGEQTFLGEMIKPLDEDKRYRFKYFAERPLLRHRTSDNARDFTIDEYFRARPSRADGQTGQSFLTPIARNAKPGEIRDKILSVETNKGRYQPLSSSTALLPQPMSTNRQAPPVPTEMDDAVEAQEPWADAVEMQQPSQGEMSSVAGNERSRQSQDFDNSQRSQPNNTQSLQPNQPDPCQNTPNTTDKVSICQLAVWFIVVLAGIALLCSTLLVYYANNYLPDAQQQEDQCMQRESGAAIYRGRSAPDFPRTTEKASRPPPDESPVWDDNEYTQSDIAFIKAYLKSLKKIQFVKQDDGQHNANNNEDNDNESGINSILPKWQRKDFFGK